MNPNAIRNHSNIVSVCDLSSLYATSARKDDDVYQCSTVVTHALDEDFKSASVKVVDFDAVKNHYYNNCVGNVPCSVDAATFERDGVYLVEFKCGGADRSQLIRKIYDSVMLLIEHDNCTFQKARLDVHYIVVSAGLESWSARQKAISRSCGFMKEPWKAYAKYYDHWRLASLEGVIVRSVYTMPPDMFDYFVKYKHWI